MKMPKRPTLLRRPLPPKLPKLPSYKKRVHTAKTVEIKQPDVEVSQRKVTSALSSATSKNQSQTSVSVQTLLLGHPLPERVTVIKSIATSKHQLQDVCFQIPDTAYGSLFFPTCQPASSRVFGKEISQTEHVRKSKTQLPKLEGPFIDEKLKNVFILTSATSKTYNAPCPLITCTFEDSYAELPPKIMESPSVLPQLVLSTAMLRPLPSFTSPKLVTPIVERLAHGVPVALSFSNFPGSLKLPVPIPPRKPQIQSTLEYIVVQQEQAEVPPKRKPSVPVQGKRRIYILISHLNFMSYFVHLGILKIKKKDELETAIIRGDGFNTVSATQYETIMAMANMAILNCQVHGRNALNLQGFFIINCPDLTPLALQLVYLNLSFNDLSYFPTEVFCLKHLQVLKLRNNPIKEIPSEIQKLKYLRIFTIAFNWVSFLPPGLFALAYLEKLDVSYNELTSIPNEISKLRSLEKLNVDGNYLTSFPPGILKINLKKIQFDNNYTHPYFWKENSLNTPQCLTHLTCSFFLKHNLQKYHDVIPEEIQNLLRCTSCCDWCRGPMFGEGFRIIRSCDVFGVTQFPIMFHVCSSACYGQVKHSS
ncbi:leucine-rich repeat-containing protein 63 [Tenrec ecaudatus]|uniref:leucine-rich repeat-containing protein 63 n=1 Tax=Tenrec ecaudatus TaxID=94439 RepID=UPI003F59D387